MADNFVGEIRIFSGNFEPKGWAFCDGRLLPIAQNTALFSLLGTNYGGDGRSTFGLPNLVGSIPLHAGGGGAPAGLTPRSVGQSGGTPAVTLTTAQMPGHAHAMDAAPGATTGTPDPTVTLAPSSNGTAMYRAPDATALNMNGATAGVAGGGQPPDNLPPVLAINFIIALQGIFPPRA